MNSTTQEQTIDHSTAEVSCASRQLAQARAALHGQSELPTNPQPFAMQEFVSPIHNLEGNHPKTLAELAIPASDQVDLRVEIGQTLLSIEHVMDLRKGCVVQLDQAVNQPVILFADDRQVATGELVVVDGRFGVRITHRSEDSSIHQESVEASTESA